MIWLTYGLSTYLLIGIITVTWERKRLYMEIAGRCYDSKKSPKFYLALGIILTLAVTIWPSILVGNNRKAHQRGYVIEDVTSTFTSISKDRGEELEAIELSLITCKFITLYEKHGLKMYEEHLKYELGRYREEGLREDYKGTV